jgi:DNA topoisomerase 2-associated protein PAT1
MQSVPMGPMAPVSQDLIIQELLYHQQQQQQRFIQQRAQQQHFDMENNEPVISTEAQLRMQEAEAKHRRRMAKIQSMVRSMSLTHFILTRPQARYNDLMTQSDKDFITRVQVAQLVTSDPYAEDFYAQVYASIRQQRSSVDSNTGKAAPTGGGRGPHRRENAIQRMQAQVERLVNNMKNRELSKENSGV